MLEVTAQEQPQSGERRQAETTPHQTRVWKIAETNTVWIIETEGVCLYVIRDGGIAGIAAVPKTQLPPGVGCQ